MRISVQNISKAYDGRDIFSDFSLEIDPGVRLCVCGSNGTGKSTFLRMLAGEETPDFGKVVYPRNCRVGYVEQNLDSGTLGIPLLTWVLDVLPAWHEFWGEWERAEGDSEALRRLAVRQTELEHLYGYNPEHRAKTVLGGLGFSEEKWLLPIGQLSGGWRERAKLARVLVAGADVLLLDEPTNHLDLEAVEWLEQFLLEYKGVLVFVAHDRVFMDRIGSHVLYLGLSKPVFRKATFTQFLALQEEFEIQRDREAQRLNAEIERKLDFVRRFGVKATKARQAQSKQKQARKLEKELEGYRPEVRRKELSFKWPEAPKADRNILAAADLSFAFPDGTSLWPPLTFNIYDRQRIALVGPNGCGKSTMLKLLVGEALHGGSLSYGQAVKIGYYSQHQSDILRAAGTVLSEIRRLSDPRTMEQELMSVLGLFMLGQGYFDREVGTLSGGEQARLVLASLFLRRCNFLVMDEPTNHLDLESREALVQALQEYDGTLLLVAHDRYLLQNVIDEAWAVSEQGITVYKEGFEQYDAARRAALSAAKDGKGRREAVAVDREAVKRLRREQAEWRNALYKRLKPKQDAYAVLEEALGDVLERQEEAERLLAMPEVYADGPRMTGLLKVFDECKKESERLFEEMAVLEEEIKALEAEREAVSTRGQGDL